MAARGGYEDVLVGPGESEVAVWRHDDRTGQGLRREWVRLALAHADYGLCLVDRLGRARRANHAFEKLVGFDERELRRLPFTAYTHTADVGRNVELWQRLRANDLTGYSFVKRYRSKGGRAVSARLTVFRDGRDVYSIVDPTATWSWRHDERVALAAGGAVREPVVDVDVVDERVAVVRLLGEHDMASANEVAMALASVGRDGRTAVVDVTETQYIDSAVVNVLYRARNGIVLQFATTAVVRVVLEITGLLDAVPCAATRGDAIALACQREPPA